MYRAFFGLSKLPFKSSPDIDVFYKNGSRQDILEALIYTIVRGDGITKVTGEVGSGKTMLLRLVAESLPENCTVLYINTPNLSPKEMLMHICAELGLDLNRQVLKFSLLELISKELLRLYACGQRVVMLIDEAQAMTFDTLEEIRLLSNLETSDGKLLQMVLFGQPELDAALSNDKIRQLKSRISYSIFIPPLTPEEVCSYLNYRMRRAAYEGLDVFDLTVSKKIHRLSLGVPRAINIIADKLLMSAYSQGEEKVTKKHLLMLPKDILGVEGSKNNRFYSFLILMLVLFVFLYLTFVLRPFNLSLNSDLVPLELFSQEGDVISINAPLKEEAVQSSFEELKKGVEESLRPSISLESAPKVDDIRVRLNAEGYARDDVELNRNYRLNTDESGYFTVNGSLLPKGLVSLHLNTVEWLMQMPEQMYIIQLASPHMSALEEAMNFYQEQNVSMETIHLLIDLGHANSVNRFRVFYLASASYSTLERIISELPPELMKSKPYVVTVGGVLKNLGYTQNNLKQHGIINVTQ